MIKFHDGLHLSQRKPPSAVLERWLGHIAFLLLLIFFSFCLGFVFVDVFILHATKIFNGNVAFSTFIVRLIAIVSISGKTTSVQDTNTLLSVEIVTDFKFLTFALFFIYRIISFRKKTLLVSSWFTLLYSRVALAFTAARSKVNVDTITVTSRLASIITKAFDLQCQHHIFDYCKSQ